MKIEQNKFVVWLKRKLGTQKGEFLNSDNLSQKELMNFASSLNVPEENERHSIWEKLSDKIEEANSISKPQRNKSRFIIYSIAASIAILIGLTFILTTIESEIICERGQKLTYILPDSSEISLNSDSRISYNKFSYSWDREIKLKGEAFFRVKKGGTFKVHTKNTLTTVLGTSFNIYARQKYTEVACKTGKVKVEAKDLDDEQILTSGYKVKLKIDGSLSEKTEVAAKNIANWENGKFIFKKSPIEDVIEELERQFAIKIVCENCQDRYYTGHFYNNNLEEAMKMVCIPLQMRFKIKGEIVQFYK